MAAAEELAAGIGYTAPACAALGVPRALAEGVAARTLTSGHVVRVACDLEEEKR